MYVIWVVKRNLWGVVAVVIHGMKEGRGQRGSQGERKKSWSPKVKEDGENR